MPVGGYPAREWLKVFFYITAIWRNLPLLKRALYMMRNVLTLLLASLTLSAFAQPDRWQQRIKYTMNVDMNVQTNQFAGKQKIDYWNNSPDTLNRVFFHLYWNAFQPNSMMDMRSRRQGTILLRKGRRGDEMPDWDPRVE